jgi:hypothetical protein
MNGEIAGIERSTPQGLNVVSQEVVYIARLFSDGGYGKGEKLKGAFHFPTTPAIAPA